MSLEIDTDAVLEALVAFLREEFGRAGRSRAVVGLSGGVDSALTLALSARALGPENVWAILMPYRTSSPESVSDAKAVVERFGVNEVVEEITPQIDAYFGGREEADEIRRGNKMARERMAVLYDWSWRLEALVVGTGNRTEWLLGYTTMYGDNACALNPIGDLYKTQVRRLAAVLDVPRSVIGKPPSADLWTGQTDEDEMGFTYAEVDPLLHAMTDRGLDRDALIGEGFDPSLVDRVRGMIERSRFKRRLPPVARLRDRPGDPDAGV